jgi:hypothetical protein
MESGGRGGLGSAPPLCGLNNLGNTCYVNALLQMLCASEELVQLILNSCAAGTLGLADVIMQMRFPEKGQNAIAPYDFVGSIYSPHCTWVTSYKAKKDEQHASDEFLFFLMQSIPELFNCAKFDLMQPDRTLSEESTLPVHITGSDLNLQELIRAQYPPGYISNLSNTLIVVVVRYTDNDMRVKKNTTQISVSEGLELLHEKDKVAKFAMRAVVVHTGKTNTYGHYTTYSKHTVDHGEQWFHCDDSKITPLKTEDTLREAGKGLIFMFEQRPMENDDDEKVCEVVKKPDPVPVKKPDPVHVKKPDPGPVANTEQQSAGTDKKRTFAGAFFDGVTRAAVGYVAGCALAVLREAPAKQDNSNEECPLAPSFD